MRNPRLAVVLVAVSIVGAVGGFAWYSWYAAARNQQPLVRIGYLPIYVDLPLFVAAERGFFDEQGIRYHGVSLYLLAVELERVRALHS